MEDKDVPKKDVTADGLTLEGRGRNVNSDQFLIANLMKSFQLEKTSLPLQDGSWMHDTAERKLLLVADGLGNFDDAKGASGSAAATISEYMLNAMPWFYGMHSTREHLIEQELRKVLEKTDARIRELSEKSGTSEFVGTALAFAYVIWPVAYIVKVGSCECHIYRAGKLERVDPHPGEGVPDGGDEVPVDGVLAGGSLGFRSELYKIFLQHGDTLLLSTDGLNRNLDHEQVRTVLDVGGSPQELCRNLAGAAQNAGASDNVTVVAASF